MTLYTLSQKYEGINKETKLFYLQTSSSGKTQLLLQKKKHVYEMLLLTLDY